MPVSDGAITRITLETTINGFQFHVPLISVSGVPAVHERLLPQLRGHLQCLVSQCLIDLAPLRMLADGVGPGGKLDIDRMVRVRFLVTVLCSVLPAGQPWVLWRCAVAVFWSVAGGGEKILPAVVALAGCVSVVEPVEQIEGVDVQETVKAQTVDKY